MGAAAALVTVVGILGLVWGFMQKLKSGRLASAPFVKTGDAAQKGDTVAGPKGAISVEGDVKCDAPLKSPVTGTPCLYYELKVVGTWKEGDSNKSKDYLDEKHAASFTVDDGSGPVKVTADKGGDFELERTFEETKKEGFLADLAGAVGKGKPIMFKDYAFPNPPMSKADKFTCTERVVKMSPRLFVVGKHEAGAIGPPSWASLILSSKTREQLLGATAKAAKMFLIGGGAASFVGVVLGVISLLIAKPDDAAAAAALAAAEAGANPAVAAVVEGQAAADAGGQPAAAADEAPAETSVCEKAVKCCGIASPKGPAHQKCEKLATAKEALCKKQLVGFKKIVKAKHKDQLAECE